MLLRTILVLGTVAFAAALPREHRQIGFFAPPPWAVPSDYSDQSSEEVGFPGASPQYSSLGSMLKSMQEMMVNMRRQFTENLGRLPQVPSFPRIGFKPSDSAPTNSTSITKVVNGHEVTVNETTYESQDGGHMFRIKTVDIKPHEEHPKTSSTESTEKDDSVSEEKLEQLEPAGKPQESTKTEDEVQTTTTLPPLPDENEIPQSIEDSGEEWQPEVVSSQAGSRWPILPVRMASDWQTKTHYSRGYSPDIEMVPGVKPIDLSGDLRVNQILSDKIDAGALIMADPDSEFIELKDGKIVPEIQSL